MINLVTQESSPMEIDTPVNYNQQKKRKRSDNEEEVSKTLQPALGVQQIYYDSYGKFTGSI